MIAALILINSYLFVVPAVYFVTALALNSLVHGKLLPDYKDAYVKESISGGINVLLAVTAISVSVWKVGSKMVSKKNKKQKLFMGEKLL